MKGPLLEIKDLNLHFKVFVGFLKVLNEVNFTVGPKEKVGLVGETGCGKTTTMKAIMRILGMTTARITKGEILFEGRDILKMNGVEIQEMRRKKISMIFQDPTAALNPVFSIGSQLKNIIKYSVGLKENLTKKEIETRLLRQRKNRTCMHNFRNCGHNMKMTRSRYITMTLQPRREQRRK